MRKLKIFEIERIEADEFKQVDKIPVVLVLDNIRSAHNVGSFFRTADAFRIEHIFLCGITAQPPSNEIRKTALGATESVNWTYMDDSVECVDKLKEKGFTVAGVEQVDNPVLLQDFCPEKSKPLALVFGNEVKGVRQRVLDNCHFAIEIPQFGTKHSLNVSVSGGIVIWEVFKKIGLQLIG
ncbi:MAG: RNA methyltransferase [Salinivirgaceae bacterium]|jgi:23S rRNA (guanosine2251-2'-O)-methyltransferase|nr:RNA methyltransferase [Salinivirgaceae bacterium]